MHDLQSFSDTLHTLVTERPDEYLPILESAAREVAIQMSAKGHEDEQMVINSDKVTIQAQLKNFQRITQIRNLAADHVGKLVTIRGIVVSASRPRIKATDLTIMCRSQFTLFLHHTP
jgi:DNA replication licensing factor MCM5